ncbi:MAG: metalloregulator ArsR/SmtB family transcription factor [Pseudomonadota bacterium]
MDSMNDVFDSVARYFALLSEPTRLRIMHSICQQEKSVNQIVDEIGASQTNVSRHLGLMHRAGVLGRRKDGNQVLYRVTDAAFTELCRTVCVRVAAELDGDKSLKRKVKSLINELS